MRAFDRLGVYDAVARSAVFPSRGVFRDAVDGSVLTVLDFGKASLNRYGYPTSSPTAATFSTLCSRLARPSPASRWRTTARRSMSVKPPKQAEVAFADGETYRARILIGADGIRSRVRHLLDDSDPIFSGHVAYRGAIAMEDVPADVPGGGRHGRGAALDRTRHPPHAVPGAKRRDVQPGRRLRAAARTRCKRRATSPSSRRRSLAPASRCVPRSHSSTPHAGWPVYDRDPLSTWSTDHAVLIGDAAHAMLQYLGQGACQALEDGRGARRGAPTLPRQRPVALNAYEQVRRPMASRCQSVARPWGDLLAHRGPHPARRCATASSGPAARRLRRPGLALRRARRNAAPLLAPARPAPPEQRVTTHPSHASTPIGAIQPERGTELPQLPHPRRP